LTSRGSLSVPSDIFVCALLSPWRHVSEEQRDTVSRYKDK